MHPHAPLITNTTPPCQVVSDNATRYKEGLTKLMGAEQTVAKLKVQLTALQPTLEKAEVDVGNFMKQLEVDQKNADEAKKVAAVDEAEATKVGALSSCVGADR
jgi:hypothetical protein